MGIRVGVDIGGTFTDLCALDDRTGQLQTMKVFSRPDEPGADVAEAIRMLGERYDVAPGEISHFTHGTTVGINAIIQRNGIRLALVTTRNFNDVLEIARLKMPDPYNFMSRRPDPLIPREMTIGFDERLDADGNVLLPPTEDTMDDVLRQVRALNAEGVVISLLHSYRNPAHEKALQDHIKQNAPELPVFRSSEVWPIIREYERTVTSVLHGYVQPKVSHYIDALQNALRRSEVTAQPMLTTSNGGLMTAEAGKTACAQMLLSGTASGVVGAAMIARQAGLDRVMSVDIGGTSADVALILSGQPNYGVGEIIGDFPIYIPSVSVTSIGGGGGSIAQVDAFGMLKVGPESAGSTPGPACYGRGGTRATVSDALCVIGCLGIADLGYDQIKLDREASLRAVGEIADALGTSVEDAAQAILDVVISDMHLEISKMMSKEGIDPRELSLLAFGGAGPMLTCFLARELGVEQTVIPQSPGVLAALGGLVSDVRNDFIATLYQDLTEDLIPTLERERDALERQAHIWLRDEQGFEGEDVEITYSAEMRYRGQSYEIPVALADGRACADIAGMAKAFHAHHDALFNYADPKAPVQIIALRLTIAGIVPKPEFTSTAPVPHDTEPDRHITVFLDGKHTDVALFHRSALTPGARFSAPAIVVQSDTTICIPAGMSAHVDAYSNLIVT